MNALGRSKIGRFSALVALSITICQAAMAADPAPPESEQDGTLQPVGFNSVSSGGAPLDSKQARRQAYEQGIEEVRQSGILQKALGVGDKAPDFELPSANGSNVRLSEMLAVGPVVVTFYRGNWCPYCNHQLQGLQEVLLELHSAGAQLLAVSPEVAEQGLTTERKNQLAFPLLSDKGNVVAKQYGIVFRISDKVIPYYDQFFDIEQQNGDRSYELPLAATYVIGSDSVIRYAFFDADYKQRADPQEVLEAVHQLNGGATPASP